MPDESFHIGNIQGSRDNEKPAHRREIKLDNLSKALKDGQIWQGYYTCRQGRTSLTLRIKDVSKYREDTERGAIICEFFFEKIFNVAMADHTRI